MITINPYSATTIQIVADNADKSQVDYFEPEETCKN